MDTKQSVLHLVRNRSVFWGFYQGFCHQVRQGFITLFRVPVSALFYLMFEFEVEGAEHLPEDPGVILAGNHTGYLDSIILMAAYDQPIRFLVHEKVFSWPVVGWLISVTNMIKVSPTAPKASMTRAVQRLNDNETVCIFPEGKLTTDGNLNPFQPGVGLIHRKSGSTIVPFAIEGGFEAWAWGRKLPRPGKITLRFGAPLQCGGMDNQTIADHLYDIVAGLLNEAASEMNVQAA